MKKVIFSEENTSYNNDFRSTIYQSSQSEQSLNREKEVVMRAMRKKLNIFTLHLPIYYILE